MMSTSKIKKNVIDRKTRQNKRSETPAIKYQASKLQAGRRQRLWQQISTNGAHVLTDQQILEVCLYITNVRKDTYNLAKVLLKEFGTLKNCILADRKRLMTISGISANTVSSFKCLVEFCRRFMVPDVEKKDVIRNWRHVIEYVRVHIGHKNQEHVLLLFLNNQNQLIHNEINQIGSSRQVYIYPEELVKKCLELDAHALIVAHNHPSDNVKPSKADIEQTKKLQNMLEIMNIKLHDHIIIGASNFFSFRTENIIQ